MGELTWQGNTPFSTLYNDPYYSPENGVAEAEYVFLSGNNLPARWHGADHFTIAELGFGTGLNFLLTVKRWRETQPNSARLKYISFEKHPLSLADIQHALVAFPEIAEEAELFYSSGWDDFSADGASPGQLLWSFPQCNVVLDVWVGDVEEMLPNTQFEADAWYLDGFAPAKNPAMWQPHILNAVAQRTAISGTCATFTAAGAVRRNLEQAGFVVERIKGHGHKQHMTIGHKTEYPKTATPA